MSSSQTGRPSWQMPSYALEHELSHEYGGSAGGEGGGHGHSCTAAGSTRRVPQSSQSVPGAQTWGRSAVRGPDARPGPSARPKTAAGDFGADKRCLESLK